MTDIVTAIISAISPSALPIVVCVLGCVFIYFKIGRDRDETKVQRDADSKILHDMVQKNTWEINNLKLENQHKDTILDDLRQQCNELNVNLAVVSQKLDALVEAIKELKDK